MKNVLFVKFKKSVILMMVVISLMTAYTVLAKGEMNFAYFLVLIPLNIFRLINAIDKRHGHWIKPSLLEDPLRVIVV